MRARTTGMLLGLLSIVGLLLGAACTTGAPTPATSPSPSGASKPAAAPTTAAQAAKPDASAAWKAEWDKIVAAAKQEGQVVVAGAPGETPRTAAMAFQKAYPDIQLEFVGLQGNQFGPRILAEREGGRFLWDVHMGGTTTILTLLKPRGVLDPLRPALVMPEVIDSSKWLGGFDDIWMDKDRQLVLAYEGRLRAIAYVNRDLIPESELNSLDQLVDPKFKGKIIMQDPRVSGPAGPPSGYLLKTKGEEWLRKYYAQEPIVTTDARGAAEAVVRGRYAIGVCLDPLQVEYFAMQGVSGQVKPLEIQSGSGAQITAGFGNLTIINRAPHPNAAKVYANWQLSQEGQKAYVEATNLNSRRLDVTGPAATAPNPTVKYLDIMKEENLPDLQRAQAIAKELIKQ